MVQKQGGPKFCDCNGLDKVGLVRLSVGVFLLWDWGWLVLEGVMPAGWAPSLFWYTECVMIVTLGLGVEEGGADFLGHADVACLKIWAIWIQALVMLEL